VSDYYHDDPVKKTAGRKLLPKFVAASVLMLFSLFYYGTTLASTINLNSGGPREFGLGVTITAPCTGSQELTVTPTSFFLNGTNGGGSYYLNSVKVAGIPASCNGKDFSLSFYDSVTGSSALPIFSFWGENKRVATVYNSAGYFLPGFQSSGTEVSSASGAFTVTFTTRVAIATDITKVTLQTTDHKDWAEASIASTVNHTCTLLGSSGVKCWGAGLGNGLNDSSTAPANVSGLSSGVLGIAAGDGHSCAVLNTGAVKCWGANGSGQLGNGTTTQSLTPVNVQNLSGPVSAVSTGYGYTCALLRTGGVQCWGGNGFGQLGNGTTAQSLTPVNVSGLSSGVRAIAAGKAHTCAVLSTGAVKCWGLNSSSQLGNDSTNGSSTPGDVSNLSSGVIAIATGEKHTCALLSTGAAKCWGANGNGQLGDNSNVTRDVPVNVQDITTAVAISTGGNNSCALLSTGGVQCWGQGNYGQLGNGLVADRYIPGAVSNLSSGVRAITTGLEHSCAVLSTGAAKCWGRNQFGQLGTGSNSNHSAPESVTGIP